MPTTSPSKNPSSTSAQMSRAELEESFLPVGSRTNIFGDLEREPEGLQVGEGDAGVWGLILVVLGLHSVDSLVYNH